MSTLLLNLKHNKITDWFYSSIYIKNKKSKLQIDDKFVEVKSLNENGRYKDWTLMTRFATGCLDNIIIRELN